MQKYGEISIFIIVELSRWVDRGSLNLWLNFFKIKRSKEKVSGKQLEILMYSLSGSDF